MQINDDASDQGVKAIVLNETDRELIWMAARILMALDPGPTREEAAETIAQAYRDDISGAHVGAAPEMLDELTLGFSGALLLEMQRRVGNDDAEVPRSPGMSRLNRPRVLETIGRYMRMVDPRH
jgi:hypothetical protein